MKCESILKEENRGTENYYQSYYNFYLKPGLVIFFRGISKVASAYFCLSGQYENVSVCFHHG